MQLTNTFATLIVLACTLQAHAIPIAQAPGADAAPSASGIFDVLPASTPTAVADSAYPTPPPLARLPGSGSSATTGGMPTLPTAGVGAGGAGGNSPFITNPFFPFFPIPRNPFDPFGLFSPRGRGILPADGRDAAATVPNTGAMNFFLPNMFPNPFGGFGGAPAMGGGTPAPNPLPLPGVGATAGALPGATPAAAGATRLFLPGLQLPGLGGGLGGLTGGLTGALGGLGGMPRPEGAPAGGIIGGALGIPGLPFRQDN